MNARFNPTTLDMELVAAGISHDYFTGCRSNTRADQDGTDDIAQIIDWAEKHPTDEERKIAEAVLTDHDKDAPCRNLCCIPDADIDQLKTDLAQYETLTDAEKAKAVSRLYAAVLTLLGAPPTK